MKKTFEQKVLVHRGLLREGDILETLAKLAMDGWAIVIAYATPVNTVSPLAEHHFILRRDLDPLREG